MMKYITGLFLIYLNSIASFLNAKDGSQAYILKTGEEAAKTLEIQNELLKKDSHEQLNKAGLSPGQTVWDIGCGNGAMTEYLAKAVGAKGHVYALDISAEQINVSKKRIARAGLTNVTFIQGDINSLENLPPQQADIVYVRFVLMHVKEPRKAIEKMRQLLKPGGVLALQESIMNTAHFSIENKDLQNYTKTLVALGAYKGVDFNIGGKLHDLCQEEGFNRVKAYYLRHKLLPQQAKTILLQRINEWGNKAIEANLTKRKEIEQWKLEIQKFSEAKGPHYYATPKQAYILAWK